MSSVVDDSDEQQPKYEPTSTHFQPRYTGPTPEEMTPEQLSLRQSILASRPRTGLAGPFGPWLAVPSIARPSQELGRTVRYNTSLSMRESELVILLTGAKFKSEAEFDIHVGEARRAGVDLDVILSIPRGADEFSLENVMKNMIPLLEKEHDDMNAGRPDGEDDVTINVCQMHTFDAKEREVAIVLFSAEVLDKNTVSDSTYATTKQVFGKDSALVEITALIGYYAYVAYTLNVFKIASTPPK